MNTQRLMMTVIKFAIGIILFCNISMHRADAMTYSANENFNSSTVGAAPPTGWTTDTNGGSVTVQAVPTAANKSVEIYKTGTANNAGATRTFPALSGTFTVEARVMVSGSAGYISAPYIGSAVNVFFQNGFIKVYSGSSVVTVQAFTAGTWYDFRFVVNTATQTFDFYIDGIEMLTQGAFRYSTQSISTLWFNIGTGWTGTLFFDNVRVYTDNPQTVSYLVNEPFDNGLADQPPSGWTITGTGASGTIEVVPFPNGYNSSAQIDKTGTAGTLCATKTFTSSTGTVVVQANVLGAETTGYKNAFYVYSSSGSIAVSVAFYNGYIQSYVGGTLTSLQPFSANTWYTVKAIINVTTDTYDLYIDGCKLLSGAACRSSVTNLASLNFAIGSSYTGTLCFDNVLVYPCITSMPSPIYDPFNYGATGSGTTTDTAALQAAINACAGTGGSVYLHNGTFLSGGITLGSNMTFYIDSSATLLGSQLDADYPILSFQTKNSNLGAIGRALISASAKSNVHIDGLGTINGNGNTTEWAGLNLNNEYYRPSPILLVQGTNNSVKNIYITNGANWTVALMEITNLTVSDININSTVPENRDGIDICDCTNTLIERCNIFSDDDSICFKSGIKSGVNNARVRYCNVGTSVRANGIKFGTCSLGGFKDIIIEDVNIKNCDKGGISTEAVDGASIYNLTFRRITANAVGSPIYITLGTRSLPIGGIDDIRYEAISASNLKYKTGSPISGVIASGTTYSLYSLLFSSVDIEYLGGLTTVPATPPEMGAQYPECNIWGNMPAYGYFIRHANGVTFRDCATAVSPNDVRPWIDEIDVANWSMY